jgi:hypothetical protein
MDTSFRTRCSFPIIQWLFKDYQRFYRPPSSAWTLHLGHVAAFQFADRLISMDTLFRYSEAFQICRPPSSAWRRYFGTLTHFQICRPTSSAWRRYFDTLKPFRFTNKRPPSSKRPPSLAWTLHFGTLTHFQICRPPSSAWRRYLDTLKPFRFADHLALRIGHTG